MSERYDTEQINKMIAEGGIFDDEVITRAKELIRSGDMDLGFWCDECDRGDCNDCQKEPMYDEGRE
jgi:hypothetical protein